MFKTSFEIDQRWLIELAADRTPFIDQAQSLNLFIPADVDKWDLLMLHLQAWEKGIKSLYYLRSKTVQRAGLRRRGGGGQHRRRAEDRTQLGAANRPITRNASPASRHPAAGKDQRASRWAPQPRHAERRGGFVR